MIINTVCDAVWLSIRIFNASGMSETLTVYDCTLFTAIFGGILRPEMFIETSKLKWLCDATVWSVKSCPI